MSFTTHGVRYARIRRTAAVLGGTVVAALSLTSVAAASNPSFVAGNPDCEDIQGSASWLELKRDSPSNGTNRLSNSDLSAVATVSGLTFDWTASTGIDAVIVKGGPNANVYTYSEATSGTGLHAPENPSNGSFYGLSHITFCYDRGTPPPPPPADPCVGNPNGTKANGEPCTPAPKDPCADDPNGTKTNGEPCTPAPKDPCADDPNGTKANGEPCTPARDVCAEDPNGMKPGGEPCTPAKKDPCVENPSGMTATGEPCTWASFTPPAPPAPPVVTSIPSLAPPISGGSLGRVGEIVPAAASIVRLKRCVARPFSAIIRGRGIRRVTMFVNGRKVRTMSGGRRRYALRVLPSQARGGVIRISARVEFVAASGKRAQTLKMTALRCSVGAQQVRFAG